MQQSVLESPEVNTLESNKYLRSFFSRALRLFLQNELTAAAAEMAYYLVFAFFPLLMVVHASLSMVLSDYAIQNTFFYSLLPDMLEELVKTYLDHVGENGDLSFLFLGIFLTVYTLSKFMKSAKRTIRRIYRSKRGKYLFTEWGISIVLSFLIIAAFYVSLFLLILGGQLLGFVEGLFPAFRVLHLESLTRILFTAATIYTVVTLFYLWIPHVKQSFWDVLPGTVFTSVSWVLVSSLFSFYMNHFSKYSLIYGSLGAFIMLMLWIYMSCLILLLGAVVNAALRNKPDAPVITHSTES